MFIPPRALKALGEADVKTAATLIRWTSAQLLTLPNLGKAVLRELHECLASAGLSLATAGTASPPNDHGNTATADLDSKRPLCRLCGERAVCRGGKARYYQSCCWKCKEKWGERGKKRRLKEGLPCSRCGFTPEIPEQMEVDHLDGNRRNNRAENLQILCANCHRLKTIQNKDGRWRSLRAPLPGQQIRPPDSPTVVKPPSV